MSEKNKIFEDLNERFRYLQQKRLEVLNQIKPMCDAFDIEYDYRIHDFREVLILNGQKIACNSNSIEAIITEVIGYIFITRYCQFREFPFKAQLMNSIKKFWMKDRSTEIIRRLGL